MAGGRNAWRVLVVVLSLAAPGAAFFVIRAVSDRGEVPSEVRLESRLTESGMEPATLVAVRGQAVTLEISADIDGTLHLHAYDLEIDLQAGETVSLAFAADVSGQFPIELHAVDGEREVGILRVEEP